MPAKAQLPRRARPNPHFGICAGESSIAEDRELETHNVWETMMPSRPAVRTIDHDQSAWTQEGPNGGEQGRICRAVRNPAMDKVSFERPTERAGAAPTEVSFGPFRLFPTQFLLLEGDQPVPLGSRALEILIVLVEYAGELVSKHQLMAQVWPNLFVEPANLTVHVSRLRRMLRDGQDGNRFIINIPGRGYSFVAPVDQSGRDNTVRNRLGNSAYLPRTAPSASRD